MAEAVRMEEALRIMLKDSDQRMGCVSLELTQIPNLNPKPKPYHTHSSVEYTSAFPNLYFVEYKCVFC